MWRTQEEMFGYGLLLAPWGRKTVPLTLAVWDGGTKATADHAAWIDEQIAAGRGVFVVDLAGEGQTEPYPVAPNAKLLRRYGTMYKLACDLLMLGDSLPALRIYCLLYTSTVPAVLCPARLPLTWPKAMPLAKRCRERRSISPARSPQCSTWDRAPAL